MGHFLCKFVGGRLVDRQQVRRQVIRWRYCSSKSDAGHQAVIPAGSQTAVPAASGRGSSQQSPLVPPARQSPAHQIAVPATRQEAKIGSRGCALRSFQPIPGLQPTFFQQSGSIPPNVPSLWLRRVYVTVRSVFFQATPVRRRYASRLPVFSRCSGVQRFHRFLRALTRAAVNLRI